jgi:excisionase family DNA binding protein
MRVMHYQDMTQLIDLKEIRKYIPVSRATIYRLIAAKQLEYVQIGGRKFLDESVVQAFIDANRHRVETPV